VDKVDKTKAKKKDAKGGKTAHDTTDHSENEHGWLVPLEAAMKGAPGVFTILWTRLSL